MKNAFLFLNLFFTIPIFACKCNEPTIRSSFESADFVFIGDVYDVNKTYKTGYLEVENALSRVKIDKIYKAPGDNFKSTEVTFFGQQFNSCDLIFQTKGKYLIFAYIEPDTTFFYSSHCLATKTLDKVTEADYQLLDDLQQKYFKELNAEIPEDFNYSIELKSPDKIINDLKLENKQISAENKKNKIYVVILGFLLAMSLLIILMLKMKRKKSP